MLNLFLFVSTAAFDALARCGRHLFVFLCALVVSMSPLALPAAHAQAGAVTVAFLVDGLKDLALQLEQTSRSLLQQGNTALAQQQMIAAGSLRSLATQLSDIYKGRLNDTASKIAIGQSNLALDANQILSQALVLEKATAADVKTTVYQIQGTVNQLMGRLPFVGSNPAFYGMLVHDVGSPFPKKGFDLELMGFNLTNKDRGFKRPLVFVGNDAVPDKNISVQEDRVQVLLPQAVKDKIGFRLDSCMPPRPFSVSMTVFFRSTKHFLLVPFGKDVESTFNAFALTEPDAVVATVLTSGVSRTEANQAMTFSQRGSYASVGCEEGQSGSAVANLSDKATEIACSAQWVDTRNIKNQTASCAVGGTNVTASGTISGRDRNCFVADIVSGGLLSRIVGKKTVCDCPGGGHATLVVSGTYKVPETKVEPFQDTQGQLVRFLDNFDSSVPSGQAREVQAIDIRFRRPSCSKDLDIVQLKVPSDSTAVAKQTSQNGLFTATYRAQRLAVEKVK